jgi:hypothetical protein
MSAERLPLTRLAAMRLTTLSLKGRGLELVARLE